MTDQTRFEQLVQARHPCVQIITYEEDYALQVVRHAAVENGWDCWNLDGYGRLTRRAAGGFRFYS